MRIIKPVHALICLFLIFASARVGAECKALEKCEEIWVAAQDAGIPLSFFSKVNPTRNAANIAIGDLLVAQHNINVRARPEVSEGSRLGRLPAGTQVEVEDIRRTNVEGQGPQIWLRINTNMEALKPALRAPMKSSAKQSELSDAPDTIPKLDEKARKIVGCYKQQIAGGKQTTIRSVFECSGYWVTPHALVSCSIGADCPALPDGPNGRAVLDATLKNSGGLKIDDVLAFNPTALPRQPITAEIDKCNISAKTSRAAFEKCVTTAMMSVHKDQIGCFQKATDGEKLACFSQKAGNNDYTRLIGCLAGGRPSPDKLTSCLTSSELETKVEGVRKCVSDASSESEARRCITNQLPAGQRTVANCVNARPENYETCLDSLSPDMKKARLLNECLSKSSNQNSASQCIATEVGGDVGKISGCLAQKDRMAVATCAFGDSPQLRDAQRVYSCVASGLDVSAVLYSCSEGVVTDGKTRQTIACVAKAGSDKAKLATCSVGAVLPEEAARIVGCASGSTGPTSFALCAAGPAMNEEWRIAAECAAETGGNPIGWAGCTAGRLTMRELTKCLNGKVGQDCFGPNNTIVVGLRNAYSDVTQGPGKNNDIVKAIDAVSSLTGGSNSVINNPGQIWGGPNSVFNNPGQILGGDHSVFHDPGQVLDPGRWRF
ncbi:hypothetical protein SAMN05216345_13213 [Cupriavidus sp. YR651]|uniref:hypothetical protein n=1 Tax=Cupriavidus sp. YR651 TaxID=1855315 RepID=UPI0008876DCB|nr:hypothetical protein [Cupriavidus sp. YR651]SDE01514.1 hypothetical protein SAMN05216345_13213 [Cupriavidus sp. YR651]